MNAYRPTLTRHEAAQVAARARWAKSRKVVRLDSLDPATAHAVRVLIDAAERAKARADSDAA